MDPRPEPGPPITAPTPHPSKARPLPSAEPKTRSSGPVEVLSATRIALPLSKCHQPFQAQPTQFILRMVAGCVLVCFSRPTKCSRRRESPASSQQGILRSMGTFERGARKAGRRVVWSEAEARTIPPAPQLQPHRSACRMGLGGSVCCSDKKSPRADSAVPKSSSSPGPLLPGLECPDRLENRLGRTAPPRPSSPCRDRLGALGSSLWRLGLPSLSSRGHDVNLTLPGAAPRVACVEICAQECPCTPALQITLASSPSSFGWGWGVGAVSLGKPLSLSGLSFPYL